MNSEQAWQSVLGQLQMEMPRASFDTWVRDTKATSLEDGVMTIVTRSAYARDWLESRLASTVQRLLVGILNQSVIVQFVVGDPPGEDFESEDEPDVTIEPVQWLDYDKIVQPHRQVVVKGYLRRLGMEIGPKAIWLYIGFHQAAWKAGQDTSPLFSGEVRQFTGLSNGAFWRILKQPVIQQHLVGLVKRVHASGMRQFRRGRDGRPHRMPVRYQVCMTPRLTKTDASQVYSRLKARLDQGASISNALQELLHVQDAMDLLAPAQDKLLHFPYLTVMEMVRSAAAEQYTPEIDRWAQELHRRLINCLGNIHITHYFITRTIQRHDLTPAQAWLITVARDMAYVNSRTGERREVVNFKRGYQEMAELIGSSRYKTVQAWFHPQWKKQRLGGDVTRFLIEQDFKESSYSDLRVESMPRTFRVLLDEPLDADGTDKADANGSIRLDADGSNSQTQMGVLADANGSNMVDANGSVLNSFKHSLNTYKDNISTTQHARCAKAAEAVPAFWDLKTLLQQNDVHPRVQHELLEAQTSAHAFVSWVLYVASPQSGNLSDPLGYALSRLREDPLQEARGVFRQLADLPPKDLLALLHSTPTQSYEYPKQINHPLAHAWKQAIGSHNQLLPVVRAILFGEGAHQ